MYPAPVGTMKTSYLLGTPARLETRVSNCQENRLPSPNTPFKTKASRPPQFSSSKRPRLRNSRARERTTINQPGESDLKKLNRNTKGQESELRQCYVYEIRIDGVVRYIGKGRNGRIYSHLIVSGPPADPMSRFAIYLRISGKC